MAFTWERSLEPAASVTCNGRSLGGRTVPMATIELPPLPDDFDATRRSLHRLAEDVIKVAREHVTGELTLAQTPGGFGTPEWGGATRSGSRAPTWSCAAREAESARPDQLA